MLLQIILLSLKTNVRFCRKSSWGKLLRSPTFPKVEVELERRLALQNIRSQQEQPFTIAFEQLRQATKVIPAFRTGIPARWQV